jgi:hypothetical protein
MLGFINAHRPKRDAISSNHARQPERRLSLEKVELFLLLSAGADRV